MSRYTKITAGVLALAITAGTLHAQSSANQTVTYEVQTINQIAVTGSPSLTITTATAGSQPTEVTATGSYAITVNDTARKITIGLNSDMPTDVTLTATLAAPTGATSAGALTLSSTAQDAVTGITCVIGSALNIAYALDATVEAGVVASANKTVTLTIVAGP